jgi:glucokinase
MGIDIGGTKIAYALAGADGRSIGRFRRPTRASGSSDRDLAGLLEDVHRLLGESSLEARSLAAVGVSAPGPLDLASGLVLHPPNLPGWSEVPLRDRLAEALGCRVFLENDANAAALAEWRLGAGQGLTDLVYLTMSTGVGGGLIQSGRLQRGGDGSAGEVGHAPVEWEGEPCVCGLRGCLEAYVGGAAWAQRLRETAPEDCRALVLAGSRDQLTPEHVVAAAHEADAHALAEIARFNHYLARAIVQLRFLLAPQAVVLGTIAVAAGESLCFEPLRALVDRHSWPHQARGMRILPAQLGAELPYLAGLCVAEEGLRETGVDVV